MIWIYVFARGATTTLKQSSSVTVKGVTKTTTDGTVSFDLAAPGTYNVIVSSQGFKTWQGDLSFGQYANVMDVSLDPEPPLPEGYTGYCGLEAYDLSFGRFFKVIHPDLGEIKSGYSDTGTAKYYAHLDDRCFRRYPPPPTQEEVLTRNVIQRVQGQLETAISGALEPLSKAISELKPWTSGQLKVVSQGLVDLEARVKDWIADNIFELLMKQLDQGARDVARK